MLSFTQRKRIQGVQQMRVGYIRVSSQGQNLESQKQTIIDKFGEMDKWVEEKVSGRTTEREQLKLMIEFVREGDTIYILDLSRVSRSLSDLLNLIEIFQVKGVEIQSVKDTYDINSLSGKLLVQIMGAVNEFQVNIQREKQLEGIALAKEQGKYKGRKKVEVTDKLRELYEQWKHREITKKEIMDITGLARTTLHRRFKDIEEEQS